MNIKQLLDFGEKFLGGADFKLDCQFFLSHILQKDKSYFIMYNDKEVSSLDEASFMKMIEKRKTGMPLAYILGQAEFMGLPFMVNENTLIPRPDTELLVEKAIELLSNTEFIAEDLSSKDLSSKDLSNKDFLGADICTGSGAIAISLAHYIKNVRIVATDLNKIALETASKNATLNSVSGKINFSHGDMFSAIDDTSIKSLDFILSNPPYIVKDVISTLDIDVKDFEPKMALDGGDDGLDFYRILAENSHKYIKTSGFILFEIGYDQGETVSTLLDQTNKYKDICVYKDLNNLDRVVFARIC